MGEVFPQAKYQRCTVHFYRNVFSVIPRSKVKIVATMLRFLYKGIIINHNKNRANLH